jgi:PhzF family phenazine biosynthesis protein
MRNNHKIIPRKEITEPQIFQVNAFVEKRCKGNPAGVCLLPEERDDDYYRKAAVKIDLSETAFVYEKGDIYQLRWFTRNGSEVDLCGHATLATARILWDKGYVSLDGVIHFKTKSGVLTAKLDGNYVTLGFPLEKITEIKDGEYDFGKVLGVTPVYIGRTRFDYLVEVDSEKIVKNFTPDFNNLQKIKTRGIIITAKSDSTEYDYIARFFAPLVGFDEDPVTGLAHTCLGVYWSQILNKKELIGYQASREGGMVRVTVLKDRVLLSGRTREVAVSDELKRIVLSF